IASAALTWSCGGGSGGSTTVPSGPGAVAINIVNTNGGNKAFQPTNAAVSAAQSVVWKNMTNDIHHIVMDDGSGDAGSIVPGASSTLMLKGNGGNYHCENHPTMVGSINSATAPDPPSDPNPPVY